jgi:hypothetical protein
MNRKSRKRQFTFSYAELELEYMKTDSTKETEIEGRNEWGREKKGQPRTPALLPSQGRTWRTAVLLASDPAAPSAARS